MTEKLKQTIEEEISKLPKNAQDFIGSIDWLQITEEIGKKYLLTEDEINNLQLETLLVLTGAESVDDYVFNIEDEVEITQEKAEQINKEITDSIFKPIIEKIPANEYKKPKNDITEKLDERFTKLPENTKKIIIEMGYHFKLYSIAGKYKFNVEDMAVLEDVTTDIIVGALHPDQYENELRNRLALTPETAHNLAGEVNIEILIPIRQKMEQIYTKPKNTIYDIRPAGVNAGIRINKINTPTSVNLNIPELKEGDEKVDQQMQPVAPSIFAQKLSGSVQSSTVKTDHSINNLSKNTSGTTAKTTYKVDPYRIMPE